jgi:ferredoxin
MTFVVTGNCQGCRFTSCVQECPVDCFHGDATMLYIDPEGCILCGACVPVCPVEAIHDEAALPDGMTHWVGVNAQRAPGLPVVDKTQDPLPTAQARMTELGFG